ncbi:hypothetical protein [Microcoleus sp. BROC3]
MKADSWAIALLFLKDEFFQARVLSKIIVKLAVLGSAIEPYK